MFNKIFDLFFTCLDLLDQTLRAATFARIGRNKDAKNLLGQ
jgi:hypothetical protein